ncbi:MAG: hypothetical protein KGH91_02905 [Rhodospirillales bacterium]|nr:hypothetical protein [Rhodospirillales bacterium]
MALTAMVVAADTLPVIMPPLAGITMARPGMFLADQPLWACSVAAAAITTTAVTVATMVAVGIMAARPQVVAGMAVATMVVVGTMAARLLAAVGMAAITGVAEIMVARPPVVVGMVVATMAAEIMVARPRAEESSITPR